MCLDRVRPTKLQLNAGTATAPCSVRAFHSIPCLLLSDRRVSQGQRCSCSLLQGQSGQTTQQGRGPGQDLNQRDGREGFRHVVLTMCCERAAGRRCKPTASSSARCSQSPAGSGACPLHPGTVSSRSHSGLQETG